MTGAGIGGILGVTPTGGGGGGTNPDGGICVEGGCEGGGGASANNWWGLPVKERGFWAANNLSVEVIIYSQNHPWGQEALLSRTRYQIFYNKNRSIHKQLSY